MGLAALESCPVGIDSARLHLGVGGHDVESTWRWKRGGWCGPGRPGRDGGSGHHAGAFADAVSARRVRDGGEVRRETRLEGSHRAVAPGELDAERNTAVGGDATARATEGEDR